MWTNKLLKNDLMEVPGEKQFCGLWQKSQYPFTSKYGKKKKAGCLSSVDRFGLGY